MEYKVIGEDAKLTLVEDILRARETEHYRLSLLRPEENGGEEKMAELSSYLVKLQDEYEQVKAAREAKTVVPPQSS